MGAEDIPYDQLSAAVNYFSFLFCTCYWGWARLGIYWGLGKEAFCIKIV